LFFFISLNNGLTLQEIGNMRSRELKKMLYKLGVSQEEVKKIVDKRELRDLVINLLQEEAQQKKVKVMWEQGLRWTLIAIAVGFIVIFREPFLALMKGFIDYLLAVRYQIKVKGDMMAVCYQHSMYFALVSFILACLLDLVGPLMQMSIVASWVLPSQSVFRRFLFPSLSIPVTTDMILGGMGQSKGGKSNPLSGYGLNVGPMVTMWISSFLKGRLEEFGASKIHGIVQEKERKRNLRRKSKNSKEDSFDSFGERFESREERDDTRRRGGVEFEDEMLRGGATQAEANFQANFHFERQQQQQENTHTHTHAHSPPHQTGSPYASFCKFDVDEKLNDEKYSYEKVYFSVGGSGLDPEADETAIRAFESHGDELQCTPFDEID